MSFKLDEVLRELEQRRAMQREADLAYQENAEDRKWPKVNRTSVQRGERYVDHMRREAARNGLPEMPLEQLLAKAAGVGIREPGSDDE